MRKLLLLCPFVLVLGGCAPGSDSIWRARDARDYPDPAQGVKNLESEKYSTQILASPSASAPASVQSAPQGKAPIPATGKTEPANGKGSPAPMNKTSSPTTREK